MPVRVRAGGAWPLLLQRFYLHPQGAHGLPLMSAECLQTEDDLLQIGKLALDGGDILFVLLHGGA